MESDGPYTIDEENGQYCVVGPGYQKPGARIIQNGDYWPTRMLQLDMNLAHSEGRKSMEKDLEELFNTARSLCIERNNVFGWENDGILDFVAYKKVRGIE